MRFVVLLLAFVSALSGRTQERVEPSTYVGVPAPEVVLRWLRSPDVRLQAWGAHSVLEGRYADLIPEVADRVETLTAGPTSDTLRSGNYRATYALLEALIELDGRLPAATLVRMDQLGYPMHTEVLVLLSRLPWDEAESGVRVFYKPRSTSGAVETRVAAQMLALHATRGFAADLLSTVAVRGRVLVHDASNGGGFASGFGSCCGAGVAPVRDNWPKTGRYAFVDAPKDGQPVPANEKLIVGGPDGVYLLHGGSELTLPSCAGLTPLNDAIRSHMVGTLMGGEPASPFPEQEVQIDIEFSSREEYRARVESFVDEQEGKFTAVASRLARLNLLTEEERQAAALHIELSLQDVRAKRAEDVPAIAFRPPVEWVAE